MDAGLISAGFGMLNGAIQASGQNAVSLIQANSNNAIRGINNETRRHISARNAAITSLQRWAQSVRNSRVTESIERTQEALTTNFNRTRDAKTRQNFAVATQQAEEQGRFAASAAASGVTGSVVDVIDMTANVRNNIQNEARLQEENQTVYDQKQTEFRTRWALLDNMDYSLIFDNPEIIDASQETVRTVNPLSAGIGAIGVSGLQSIASAASSLFSSPQGITQTVGQINGGITGTSSFSFNPSTSGPNYLSIGNL